MNVWLSRSVLVLAFGLAGHMAWDYQQRIFENKGRLLVSKSSVVPGAMEFSWRSAVELPMAKTSGFPLYATKSSRKAKLAAGLAIGVVGCVVATGEDGFVCPVAGLWTPPSVLTKLMRVL